MLHKLKTLFQMMFAYKNWLRLVLYRMDILGGETMVKVRDGPVFNIRSREQWADLYVANESYLYGIHDEMLPYMRKARIGLDIGAHIGTFTVFALKNSQATIYAIEPDEENLSLLKKNISLNSFDKRVVTAQAVISSKTGERDFFISKNRGLNSLLREHGKDYGLPDPSVIAERVKSFSLKDFFDKFGIGFCDFMKVDIEGAEYEVFYNLPRGVYKRIGVISLEIGGRPDKEREALENHIRSMGYTVKRVSPEFSERFCINNNYQNGFVA